MLIPDLYSLLALLSCHFKHIGGWTEVQIKLICVIKTVALNGIQIRGNSKTGDNTGSFQIQPIELSLRPSKLGQDLIQQGA